MEQLSEFLLQTYQSDYITSKDDVSILLWNYRMQSMDYVPQLCTVTVGLDYQPEKISGQSLKDTIHEAIRSNAALGSVFSFVRDHIDSGAIPVRIVVYPKLTGTDWNSIPDDDLLKKYQFACCYRNDDGWAIEVIDGHQLRYRIDSMTGCQSKASAGTSKDVNKRLTDFFQFWSRRYLSKDYIKCDIDGILFRHNKVDVIEIKRSGNPPHEQWEPYHQDAHNYMMHYAFARSIGADFILLKHDSDPRGPICTADTEILFFKVRQVDLREKNNWISADKAYIRLAELDSLL